MNDFYNGNQGDAVVWLIWKETESLPSVEPFLRSAGSSTPFPPSPQLPKETRSVLMLKCDYFAIISVSFSFIRH